MFVSYFLMKFLDPEITEKASTSCFFKFFPHFFVSSMFSLLHVFFKHLAGGPKRGLRCAPYRHAVIVLYCTQLVLAEAYRADSEAELIREVTGAIQGQVSDWQEIQVTGLKLEHRLLGSDLKCFRGLTEKIEEEEKKICYAYSFLVCFIV